MPSDDPARWRVLIAPVPIAPTKPLTLSHVKGLLWSDVLHRATGLLHSTDHLHSWTVGVDNAQTHGFWAHLDAVYPGMDFSAFDEEKIGGLYVAYQRERESGPALRGPIGGSGTLHPAGARILDLWADRYRELGIPDPGLRVHKPPLITLDALVDLLAERGLCVDHRPWNGPVYLDGTAHGLPLRRLAGADGQANYLAGVLRELVPLIGAYDAFVLPFDTGSLPDYVLVRYVLSRLGARVALVGVGRVRTDGRLTGPPRSSRYGGWEGRTAAALAGRFLDVVGPRTYRLGMRLYFIATLGRGDREPYRPELVGRCMTRAARLLARYPGDHDPAAPEPGLVPHLRRHARPHPYVDPYRLTTALLARDRAPAGRTLLEEVYV
ncbi:hypothetical protein ACFQ0X_27755 [Streptomyces rectiviolaceus]|uniref:Uncharacterized protein n=1 Tax=Streptomyces rectiviolaceus TaxID=332591 RepID=A0ABP6MD16_9ACTN